MTCVTFIQGRLSLSAIVLLFVRALVSLWNDFSTIIFIPHSARVDVTISTLLYNKAQDILFRKIQFFNKKPVSSPFFCSFLHFSSHSFSCLHTHIHTHIHSSLIFISLHLIYFSISLSLSLFFSIKRRGYIIIKLLKIKKKYEKDICIIPVIGNFSVSKA